MIQLTQSQHLALAIDRNILIEAGAGSGKTTIMIERFFALLSAHPELEPDSILVITFTKLAALELKQRVQNRLQHHQHTLSPQRHQQLLSQLHQLSFSTIDGFCASTLRQMPLLANIDPHFTVLSAEESTLRYDDAIDTTLRQRAHHSDHDYQLLLQTYSKPQIKRFLQVLSTRRQPVNAQQDALYNHAFELCQCDQDHHLTTQAISHTRALLMIHTHVYTTYTSQKNQDATLDYSDLIEKTLSLLTHHDALLNLQNQYRYIFVDEFQDTNSQQWQLIQRLCDAFNPFAAQKLCIVGDIKQSIYRFRGAEPQLFQSLLATNHPDHETTIVHLADNFRSSPPIIQFINDLFSCLLTDDPCPIPYTPLIAHHCEPGDVQFSFLPSDATLHDECERLCSWIIQQYNNGINWSDIAILSRKRLPLTQLSDYLKTHHIPVTFHGESDYFQRQPCVDLTTLAQTLLHPHDPLALAGTLLSPFIQLTYDDLYLLSQAGPCLYTTLNDIQNNQFPSLWTDFSEQDHHRIKSGINTLITWVSQSLYTPLHQLLSDIVTQTRCYPPAELTHLIAHINQLESISRSRAMVWQQLSSLPYQVSHYTDPITAYQGVNLMTIHQSKGLEFKSVAIMNCQSTFNFSKSDPIIATSHGVGLSLPATQAGTNHLKSSLIERITPDILAEEKRLFYVACTRAIKHLLLSGIYPKTNTSQTPRCFLDFLNRYTTITPETLLLNQIHYKPFHYNPLTPLTPVAPHTRNKTHTNTHPEYSNVPPTSLPIITPLKNQSGSLISPALSFSVADIELLLSCPKKYQQRSLLQLAHSQGKESIDHFKMTSIRRGIVHHHAVSYWIRHRCTQQDAITAALSHWTPLNTSENSPFIQQTLTALSEYNHSSTLTEWPFTLAIAPNYRISGRIDLLSITDQSITIIDIKTDQIDNQSIKKYAIKYNHQLCLYVMAVAKHTQRPLSDITCKLYFTDCDSWHTLSITEADIDTLTQTLSKRLPSPSCQTSDFIPTQATCNHCPIFTINPACPTTQQN